MKQQVIAIHGGDAFDTYEEYISYLKSKQITLEKLKMVGWKEHLAENLGSEFEVLLPKMPNPQNARYAEWKIWFEKLIPLFDETVIFVGTSLGGIFLSKYLSENTYPKKIKGVFMAGAPYNTTGYHPLVDFVITEKLDKFAKQAGKITLYHSKDDVIVPFENAQRFKKDLPSAELKTFEDRGHFSGEEFPEIVEDIKNLTRGKN